MSKASQAQNASMDEILSSIRSIVKEEEQRPGSTPDADDDILELTDAIEEDEAPVAAQQAEQAPKEEFVDIKTFAETGQSVPASSAAVDAARQKYESETAPVTDEQKQAAPEAAELPSTDELVAEMANEALVDKAVADTAEAETQAAAAAPVVEDAAPEEVIAEAPAAEPAAEAEAAPAAAPQAAPVAPAPSVAGGKPVSLKAIPGAQGLQVAFPVEVLAEALRPMIKDWVEANLSTIVEKLVREELSRLVDKS